MKVLKATMNQKKLLFIDHIPIFEGEGERAVDEFKKQILDVIIDHSLYRDDQLGVLFYELKNKNEGKIDSLLMDQLIIEIKEDLDA